MANASSRALVAALEMEARLLLRAEPCPNATIIGLSLSVANDCPKTLCGTLMFLKATIPPQVLHNADVKSGYALAKSQLATAQSQLAAAQHELQCGTLSAPFDGVVANVNVKAHQLAVVGQPVCRVIASDEMRVAFRVMEADIERYQIGTKLSVVPLANPSACYQAIVSEVNPVVDEQGAVAIKARLENATKLFDGMNVEVILDK